MPFDIIAVALNARTSSNIHVGLGDIDPYAQSLDMVFSLPCLALASLKALVTVRNRKTGPAPFAIDSATGLMPMLGNRLHGMLRTLIKPQ
jgi:hypothetical protein